MTAGPPSDEITSACPESQYIPENIPHREKYQHWAKFQHQKSRAEQVIKSDLLFLRENLKMGLLSPLTQSTDSVFTVRRLNTILRGLQALNQIYHSSLLKIRAVKWHLETDKPYFSVCVCVCVGIIRLSQNKGMKLLKGTLYTGLMTISAINI